MGGPPSVVIGYPDGPNQREAVRKAREEFEASWRSPASLQEKDDEGEEEGTWDHEPAAQDEFLTVVPGIGHTGSEPFENYHGWYRAIRGPCGAVRYDAILRTWTAPTHREFPLALRKLTSSVILSACSLHVCL